MNKPLSIENKTICDKLTLEEWESFLLKNIELTDSEKDDTNNRWNVFVLTPENSQKIKAENKIKIYGTEYDILNVNSANNKSFTVTTKNFIFELEILGKWEVYKICYPEWTVLILEKIKINIDSTYSTRVPVKSRGEFTFWEKTPEKRRRLTVSNIPTLWKQFIVKDIKTTRIKKIKEWGHDLEYIIETATSTYKLYKKTSVNNVQDSSSSKINKTV